MTEITPSQTRLESLHQIVMMWVWAIDNPDAVAFVRQANLEVVQNLIRREQSFLKDCGLTGDTYDWTMRFCVYVLSALGKLIKDRDNMRGIFSKPR